MAVFLRILSKFTSPGAMVFDPCIVIGSTAKTCLNELQHHNSTVWNSDVAFVEEMLRSPVKTFER